MDKEFQIAHAFGRYCEKCKNVFGESKKTCPICDGEDKLQRVMSAFKTPKGCAFVYDDGAVPGGNEWTPMSDEQCAAWHEAVNHPRPGRG